MTPQEQYMASQPPAKVAEGWTRYKRFSELIVVSALGHAAFAIVYGVLMGQLRIALAILLSGLMAGSLYPLFRSPWPAERIRWAGHGLLTCSMACLQLALLWMGLQASVAVWWLVWWPMFVAHVMGVKDGMGWGVIALACAVMLWHNGSQQWVAPIMSGDANPMFLMQIGFLLIGVAVSVVVRRAHDRFEEDIETKRQLIDHQNQALGRRAVRLENMLQALQQSSLERTRLFAQISHEVRTPLNGLLGFSQLLARSPLDAQQTLHLEQINRCGAALMHIINELLDFSRLEAQPARLDHVPFDAVQVANEAVDMVSSIAQQKGVSLVRDFAEAELAAVGDALRVKQVLLNLLANAVKFTPVGEVVVRCRALPMEDGRSALRVEVQDSGIGIAEDLVAHLFQPFGRASDTTIRQYGGSGLGLAICKRLVDMMNGRIGVESRPGAGSLFWFQVPLHLQRAAEEQPAATPWQPQMPMDEVPDPSISCTSCVITARNAMSPI